MNPQIRQNEPQTRTSRRLSRSRSLYWQSGKILLFIGLIVGVLALLIPSSNPDFDVLHSADKKTALVLTAHPDDEAMFFTPTILALVAAGWEVSALCLSTGTLRHATDILFVLTKRQRRRTRRYQDERAVQEL
jgi:hypothetical protein